MINVKELTKICEEVQKSDGGATIDYNGNNAKGDYFASCYPQYSKTISKPQQVTVKKLLALIDEINQESNGLLNKPSFYLGLWNDPETNIVYIDVSQGFNDKKAVIKACKKYKQLAYFDTKTGASVRVA